MPAMTAAEHEAHVLLIDDLRVFRQDPVCVTARSSASALKVLREHHSAGKRWLQIWLDHDLGDATGTDDDIGPVLDWLCARAYDGAPVHVDQVLVHTSNVTGGDVMVRVLRRAGYPVLRVDARHYLRVDEALYAAATRPR